MYPSVEDTRVERVRAILLTNEGKILFIKRVKPNNKTAPYWVAPGGGVESYDLTLHDALARELAEELGASYDVLCDAFTLEHHKAGKDLVEHFYVCRLHDYDLSLRHGPEFEDPSRGKFIPDAVELSEDAIDAINIKTEELRDWLIANLNMLKMLHNAA
ncbi:NUDIX domain-containing protein [Phototrophicus methaneseepsis]|uniref:NUDIX domain-containing protein n=1 Tax=Phototrophicus methaneseepsis TaxID=2710758 RepID=A0A7S8E8Q6_9CHLR|nr:NUDIX domain-containing protein [Phototrophicus methaneseepsis]QPC82436.1 NUDIX domain-containing protein [Phototrophicus methaneseepsis]